jgi:hypothetical protein
MISFFKNLLKKEAWASPGSMASWLKHIPSGDIKQAQLAIVEMLNEYFKSDASLSLNYLPAMWILSEHIEFIIQQLVQHYLQNYIISYSTESAIWNSLFEITQRLSQVYEPILQFDSATLIKGLGKEGTARSIAYYVHYKGVQAKIRLFRFEQWVPAQWAQLHKSFSLSEQANVNNFELALFNPEDHREFPVSTTIELEYANLLLLQLLNVGSFEPQQIQQVYLWLLADGSKIKVEKEPHVEGFVLDLESKEGLVRTHELNEKSQNINNLYSLRYINTYEIVNRIQAEIKETKALLLETRDSSMLNSTITVLEKCYGLWNHNKHLFERNGNREKIEGNNLLVIDNWQSIFQVLPPIPGSENYVPPPLPIYTLADHYKLIDRSSSGYGMIGSVNEGRPFKLGMLLLLYEEEINDGFENKSNWSLCVLRRLKKTGLDQAEMGVEILARYIYSMRPAKQKKSLSFRGLDGYEIDSPDAITQDDYIQTLYIKPQSHTKAGNRPSLVILKRDYHSYSTHHFPLQLESGIFTIKLKEVIEESNDWVWCSISAEQHDQKGE